MTEPAEHFQRQRWLACKNVGASTISPYGGCAVTGVYADGTLQVEVSAALYDTHMGNFAFNGPGNLPAGGYGEVSFDFPVIGKTSDSTLGVAMIDAGSTTLNNSVARSPPYNLYRMLNTLEISSPATTLLTQVGG